MANIIKLDIKNENDSLQRGDTLYYTKNSNIISKGGFKTSGYGDIVRIGICTLATANAVYVNCIKPDGTENNINLPTKHDYIFFSKDNTVNVGSLKGYYAEVKMVNDSVSESELFQINAQVSPSSK
jgi:hypothetical protein